MVVADVGADRVHGPLAGDGEGHSSPAHRSDAVFAAYPATNQKAICESSKDLAHVFIVVQQLAEQLG